MVTTFVILLLTLVAPPIKAFKRTEDQFMHPPLQMSISTRANEVENENNFWIRAAQQVIAAKKDQHLNKNIAKNAILFLGDGMSISTLKAARVLQGQMKGGDGERNALAMEKFPYTGLSKTFCVDALVPDSACTATAYLRGIKANYGTVGVNGNVDRGNCLASLNENNRMDSIARWSQHFGKRTGIVTTTRVTHASPSGAYAYTADREWEGSTNDSRCEDIASQLITGKTGRNFNVILGGGRRFFLPNTVTDEEGELGSREDDRDLIREWLADKDGEKAAYVWDKQGLKKQSKKVDYLLGLLESDHMKYYLDDPKREEPTLEEMTEAAIKVLSRGKHGYFLFVEGGRIDHAHHNTTARKALSETIEFSKAIQKARDLTRESDTLIVVTSDHAHDFTIAGYPSRGTDIMGAAGNDTANIPYGILSYANGPGYTAEVNGRRKSFADYDTSDINMMYPAMVNLSLETHSGEDVAIFASGPWAHLFTGVIEQHVIPHIMAFASCVGEGQTACDETKITFL